VDDDPRVTQLVRAALSSCPYLLFTYENPISAFAGLAEHGADVLILDLRMPQLDGWVFLETVRERYPRCKVLMLTGYAGIQEAVRAIKAGASDLLTKPVDLHVLASSVAQLLQQDTYLAENETAAVESFWGTRDGERMADAVRRVARTDVAVLITGETGTGKEVLADYIQACSPRSHKPYVKVDCAALSETLAESELFGHERGAFTGAVARHAGRFERANGGTLFLDEIGDLSPAIQSKLLRVLQCHEIERVGGVEPVGVDFRLLCATCRNLRELAAQGRFREDLLYRINVVPFRVSPLRERRHAIPGLAAVLLQRISRTLRTPARALAPEAVATLQAQPWPGNIRELEHCLERASLQACGALLTVDDLAWLTRAPAKTLAHDISALPQNGEWELTPLELAEKAALKRTLDECGWNYVSAAAVLAISRSSLYIKAKRYGLNRPMRYPASA
jgi:DNA-binding NtrC family response regulator